MTSRMTGAAEIQFDYRLKTQIVPIGELRFEIRCLESLDGTIDELFAHLQRDGRESLLEDLCPYFGVVWPAALGLAITLAERAGEWPGRCIELGCGLAVPSLVLRKLGREVVATDTHPAVPEFLARNLRLNGVHELPYASVNWMAGDIGERLGHFELVVGSDILYERRHLQEVPRAIARCLKPGGRAIISDPGRPYLQDFVDAMVREGFRQRTHVLSVPENDVKVREVFVIEFARD